MVMRLKASITKQTLQENLYRGKDERKARLKNTLKIKECSDGDGEESVQVASKLLKQNEVKDGSKARSFCKTDLSRKKP